MPNRIPDKALGEHLESIEGKLDRLERRQRTRNRLLAGALAVLAVGMFSIWRRQEDATAATANRIQASCKQQNRAFRDYTFGLVRASGGNPQDPAIIERLAQLPRRHCTPAGNANYFDNAPADANDETCVDDGKGYCLTPTTTTVAP